MYRKLCELQDVKISHTCILIRFITELNIVPHLIIRADLGVYCIYYFIMHMYCVVAY